MTPHRSVLRERDLVILATAQLVSVLGDIAAIVALALHLIANGAGGWTIAALLLAGTAPLVVLSPLAGAVADRVDSRRAIVVGVLAQAACAVGLCLVHGVVAICALLALLAAAGSIVGPATGALVPLVVGEDRIADASGVMETAFIIGNLLGPAVGGALTGAWGVRAPLVLDAVSFVLVAIGITLVHTRRRPSPGAAQTDKGSLSGFRIVGADRLLLPVVSTLSVLILVCGAVNVADVFLVKRALHGSDAVYGLVAASWTTGMVVGSLAAPRLGRETPRLLRTMAWSIAIVGCALVLAGAAPTWPVAALAFVIGGIGNGGLTVSSRTIVIQRSPEAARGRVIGVMTAAINAALVASTVAGGALVAGVGTRVTVVGCGLASLAVAVAFIGVVRRDTSPAPTGSVPVWSSTSP